MTEVTPIPMLLSCPICGHRHIDREFKDKPHHTHACQHCGNCWRPAIVPTVGVAFLPGFKDAPTIEQVSAMGTGGGVAPTLSAFATRMMEMQRGYIEQLASRIPTEIDEDERAVLTWFRDVGIERLTMVDAPDRRGICQLIREQGSGPGKGTPCGEPVVETLHGIAMCIDHANHARHANGMPTLRRDTPRPSPYLILREVIDRILRRRKATEATTHVGVAPGTYRGPG